MLYEITPDDLQTRFTPNQDIFAKSSLEKINPSNILKKWLSSIRGKDFKNFSLNNPNIQYIMHIDYSSSLYSLCDIENNTALSEEYYRKAEQIKALDDITGILSDLTSEQMKNFEEAVERRPLFK